MTGNDLSDILASCLDSMERGERSLEECLALYPEHRSELQALLKTIGMIREQADFTPRPGYRAASRARLIRRLPARPSAAVGKTIGRTRQNAYPVFSRRLVFFWASILVLVVSLATGGTVSASSEALPGDALYPVKRSVEEARLWISDDAGEVLLSVEFMQVRVEEIQALIDSQRDEDLPLAVDLLTKNIADSTEALAALAEDDPERAAQLSFLLEERLSRHTQALTSQLGMVPGQARPAIENAISASNHGREIVQRLFENNIPGGGPPDGLPGPQATQPGGGPPDDIPGPESTQPGGGPPDEIPGPASTPHGGSPPDELPGSASTPHGGGPPDGVPGPGSKQPNGRDDPPGGRP